AYKYLKEQPYDSGLYLWIMAAIKDMQTLWPDDSYSNYVADFTTWRMKRLFSHRFGGRNLCAHSEGIASAYSVLREAEATKMLPLVRDELDYWNRRNSWLQVGDTDRIRLKQTASSTVEFVAADNMKLAKGGFLTAQDELLQRIDFTQHCLSSYVQTLYD
ncbi:MAG: hypothetical protein CUN55_18515, partial [Phototrophicales bacterium]